MLKTKLKNWFGYSDFRPGQLEIINSVLEGNHTLGVLPTGSGKSLCYQFLTYEIERPTLIISPLISLMDDQVMQLKLNGEHAVAYIHSGMEENEKQSNIKKLKQSKFIFLSPEFVLQPHNFKLIKQINFGLIVLDEAHCISEWGYDFRPHYALVGKITQFFKSTTILALTATAPPHLESDLNEILNLHLKTIKISVNRTNITLRHINFQNDQEKIEWLIDFIKESGSTIIYVSSKKVCLQLAQLIYEQGYLTGIYHGDLTYQERQTVQQQFLNNKIPIIVATSAFGMGINKKDIRTVIHYHLPSSPSSYLQEIGRAGRDNQYSQAISLYQPDDRNLLETILFSDIIQSVDIDAYETGNLLNIEKKNMLDILGSYFSRDQLKVIFRRSYERKNRGYLKMLGYINLDSCRRQFLLDFFNEKAEIPEVCCDIDSDISPIKQFNRKKVTRKIDYNEKLNSLFRV